MFYNITKHEKSYRPHTFACHCFQPVGFLSIWSVVAMAGCLIVHVFPHFVLVVVVEL